MPDPKYFRAIYGCARELGLSNDDVHDAAFALCAKTSLKELTDAECRRLIDGMRGGKRRVSPERLQAMGTAGKKGEDRQSGTEFLVNSREMGMLRKCATLRGWSIETLDGFIKRQVKGPVRTVRDLNRVLWAVKAMNRRDHLVDGNDVPLIARMLKPVQLRLPLVPLEDTIDVFTAARTANVSQETMRRWCDEGHVAAYKLVGRWRIDLAEFNAFLDECRKMYRTK